MLLITSTMEHSFSTVVRSSHSPGSQVKKFNRMASKTAFLTPPTPIDPIHTHLKNCASSRKFLQNLGVSSIYLLLL